MVGGRRPIDDLALLRTLVCMVLNWDSGIPLMGDAVHLAELAGL